MKNVQAIQEHVKEMKATFGSHRVDELIIDLESGLIGSSFGAWSLMKKMEKLGEMLKTVAEIDSMLIHYDLRTFGGLENWVN